MTTNRIESEALTTIYRKWIHHCYPNNAAERLRFVREFDYLNLNWGDARDFDIFVWGCGGHIRKENGKRYIEFFDDRDATMFVLRWL